MTETITYKTGSLLDADEIAIAHGCNTRGMMGAGIARSIRDKYPDVYEQYRQACNSHLFRLGSALGVWCDPTHSGEDRLVYNLGTQRNPGADATSWGVWLSFANLAEDTAVRNIEEVAIPRIGCGIGGLKWDDVEFSITHAITNSTHPDLRIVVYDLDLPKAA